MPDAPIATPDSTAVRVALWRALHVEVDAPPHVLEDEIGLALAATVRQVAMLAPGATLAMTYILPLEFADPEERPGFEAAMKGARASGTPFISFFNMAGDADDGARGRLH